MSDDGGFTPADLGIGVAAPAPTGKPGKAAPDAGLSPADLGLPWAKQEAPQGGAEAPKARGTVESLEGLAAAGGDLLGGFASQLIGIPLQAGAEISGAFAGLPAKENLQRGAEAGRAPTRVLESLTGIPLEGMGTRLVSKLTGKGEEEVNQGPVQSALRRVGDAIQSGGEYVERKTGGAVPSEAFTQFADAIMLKAPEVGVKVAKGAAKALLTRRAARAGVDPSNSKAFQDFQASPEAKAPPTEEELRELKKSVDNHRNAEETAYDLMRRGASNGKVMRAIKKNPLVGEKLDAIRKARSDAAAAFDPDFGVRMGAVESPQGTGLAGPAREGQTVDQEASRRELPGPEVMSPLDEEVQRDAHAERDQVEAGGKPAHTGMSDALRKARKQKGGALGPKDMAAAAVVFGVPAAALWAYTHPDQAKEMAESALGIGATAVGSAVIGLGMEEGAPLPASTLGHLLSRSAYTLKTLNRLDPKRTEFPKKMIQEQLKREGVTEPEREALTRVMEMYPGETITARNLVTGFRVATGDHVLEVQGTQEYADNGIENIGRDAVTLYSRGPESVAGHTRLYRFREGMQVPDNNHFEDPRLFGWTRSFVEDGTTHVVEIQSDLVSRFEPLSEEVLAEKQSAIKSAEKSIFLLDKLIENSGKTGPVLAKTLRDLGEHSSVALQSLSNRARLLLGADEANGVDRVSVLEMLAERDMPVFISILENMSDRIRIRLEDEVKNLRAAQEAKKVTPMFKHWYRRLIREEVGRAQARLELLKEANERERKELDPNAPLPDHLRAEEEAESVIRFADADTVAKVEGWPKGGDPSRYSNEELEEARTRILRAIEQARELMEHPDASPDTIQTMRERVSLNEERLRAVEREMNPQQTPGQRFRHPGHQSLYDRYKKEVAKYLKSLGGKEVTDAKGHGWIEVPVGKRVPKEMYGGADLKMMATVALTLGGAYTAAMLADQEKLEAAIAGGSAGLAVALFPRMMKQVTGGWTEAAKIGATTLALSAALSALDKDHPVEGALIGMAWGASRLLPRSIVPKVGQMTIDELVNLANGAKAAVDRQASNMGRAMRTWVPDAARREAVAKAVDEGNMAGLNMREEREAAKAWQVVADSYGQLAKSEGLIEDTVANYVSHILEQKGPVRAGAVEQLMEALFGPVRPTGNGVGTNPSFTRARKYATFAELQNALATTLKGSGLELKTLDIAEIMEAYVRGMGKAIENKRLINNLMVAKNGPGALIQAQGKAPKGYVAVNTPQLRGMLVHPDLAAPLKFVMEAREPGTFAAGALALSMATKRLATGLSLFHSANLINAYIGARGLTGAAKVGKMLAGRPFGARTSIDAALKLFREGGNGDAVDKLIRSGLKVEATRPEDVDMKALEHLGAFVDQNLGKMLGVGVKALGPAGRAVEVLQRKTFDRLTWDYLHTGLKLDVGLAEFERLKRKNPGMPEEEVAKQVSSYVNDTFGGLDWYQVAASTQSNLARTMAMKMLSPNGRGYLQILMFAPDWTFSTMRSVYNALPGSGAAPLTAGLHRMYVLRTALIWATLMNGYNLAMSGHPIWDNKDPTKIDRGDGTTQQVAKHAMESAEWVTNFRQTALNKFGWLPKEALAQLTGKEYLSAKGKAQDMKSRIGHALSGLAPIPLQGQSVPGRSVEEGAKRTALGLVGAPIYGLTREERAASRSEDADAKRRKRIEDLLKKAGRE